MRGMDHGTKDISCVNYQWIKSFSFQNVGNVNILSFRIYYSDFIDEINFECEPSSNYFYMVLLAFWERDGKAHV